MGSVISRRQLDTVLLTKYYSIRCQFFQARWIYCTKYLGKNSMSLMCFWTRLFPPCYGGNTTYQAVDTHSSHCEKDQFIVTVGLLCSFNTPSCTTVVRWNVDGRKTTKRGTNGGGGDVSLNGCARSRVPGLLSAHQQTVMVLHNPMYVHSNQPHNAAHVICGPSVGHFLKFRQHVLLLRRHADAFAVVFQLYETQVKWNEQPVDLVLSPLINDEL